LKLPLSFAAGAAALVLAAASHAQLKPPAKAPAAPAKEAPAATAPAKDPEKEAAGQLAAAGWLTLLDRRDWGGAWERTGAVFRQNVPLGSWMDAIPKVREPFGAMMERQPSNTVYKTSLAGRPNGDYVTVVFISKFDKKAEVQETVTTMRESDGKWRVMGYSAQ
jgi:hypothetical protein